MNGPRIDKATRRLGPDSNRAVRYSKVSNALKAMLFGGSLLGLALRGYPEQQPAPPAQGQQGDQADTASKGIKPRLSAEKYASQAELKGLAMGATLLTPDEVLQVLTTDLNSCCVVLEVGLYPESGKSLEIARKDFSLRVAGSDSAVKPFSPNLLAITLKLSPRGGSMTPHGSVGVVYRAGDADPRTRQPGGQSVDTSADVSLGKPPSDSQPTELDRKLMELELTKKGLPEGSVSTPVAGYLYFPLTKKRKKVPRQLECTLAGEKITLALP